MSPSRWEHCQGKANFRPSSFDNVPLSVFLPLVRMKELGQSQSKKAFDPCNSVLKNILFIFFFLLLCSRGKGEERMVTSPHNASCAGRQETDSSQQLMYVCR